MVVFLTNRANLQRKRLHSRLAHRLATDPAFTRSRLERTQPRDPGPYRVKAETDPRDFLDEETYPTTTARLEVGFDCFRPDSGENYWFNWIEPDRNMLVGWHQDETHPELGAVHRQVNDVDEAVTHVPVACIESHPLDVFSQRLEQLPAVVRAVEWSDGRPRDLNREEAGIARCERD